MSIDKMVNKDEKVDTVLDIVKSLSANEKRYFKLYILDNSGSKNLELLYHFYEEQNKLDDREFHFSDYIKGKMNVSYERNYLKKMLLRTLRNFNEDFTDNIIALQSLIDLEILFNKKLYDSCLILIDKMIKFTDERELLTSKLQYLQWYRRILIRTGNYSILTTKKEQLQAETNKCFNQIQNLNSYRDIQSMLLAIISKKGILLEKEEMNELEEIIKNPLFEDEKQALTFHSKCHFYEAWGWYYSHTLKHDLSLLKSEEYISFLENNHYKILQYPQIYFAAVTNFTTRCCTLEQYDKAMEGIQKIISIPTIKGIKISDGLKVEIQIFTIERKLLIYTNKRNFNEALQVYEECKSFIEKNKQNVHTSFLNQCRVLVSISHFHTKSYKESLTFVRKIFDDKTENQRFDNYLYAHLLQILIHFEMKNYQIIPYQIQAAKRFCTSKKFKHKSIELFFELMSKLIKLSTEEEIKSLKLSYLNKINTLPEDKGGEIIMSTLGADYWLADRT